MTPDYAPSQTPPSPSTTTPHLNPLSRGEGTEQPAARNQQRLASLLLIAILLLATGLRVWQLGRSPLWWDEGNNAYFAHRGLNGLVEMARLTHDADPPAHKLALWAWFQLVGEGVGQIRLLSAVFGVGAVWLTYLWGRRLAGPGVGLVAALLSALSPMAIYAGREAKAYPMVLFLGLLAVYLWDRYLDE